MEPLFQLRNQQRHTLTHEASELIEDHWCLYGFHFEAKENSKACSQGQNAESLPNGWLKICLELPRTEIYRSYYV